MTRCWQAWSDDPQGNPPWRRRGISVAPASAFDRESLRGNGVAVLRPAWTSVGQGQDGD